MTLKFRILAGSALAALLSTGAASAETLSDAISSAIQSNPQLDTQRVATEIARESLEQARAGGRTTVSVGASAGYQYTDTNSPFSLNNGDSGSLSAQVQATKPIYTGGRISAGVRQARAGIDAADAQYAGAEQDLILQVVTAYMDLRRDRETVAIRQNNVDVAAEQERAAKDRFEVGVVTRTDVSLSTANLEGARAALASAEAALEASNANYSFLTGLTPQLLHRQRRCQRWFFQLLTLNHHLLQEQCFRMQVDVQQRVLLQRQGEAERLIADVLHREQVIAPRQLIQRKETILIAL